MTVRQSKKPSAAVEWKQADLAVCLGLAVLVLAVFSQTLHNGFINFDDDVYVYSNPQVSQGFSWSGIAWAFTGNNDTGNWHPLTWLSHMLDCQIYGLNPWGHHLTNVLLHAATAVLLYLALKRMTRALWPSVFVAVVFAIHPLRVESVAWASERKDVLAGFFFMLTLLMYARYVEQPGKPGGRRGFFYGLMLLFFALGLMSKSMLVTLPFVLLLLDLWPLARVSGFGSLVSSSVEGKTSKIPALKFRSLILEKLPLFLLSAAVGVIALLTQKASGAVLMADKLPLAPRLENAVVSCLAYIGKMFWPQDLAIFYPYSSQLPVWKVAGAGSLLVLVTVLVILSVRRRPYLFTGWFWYLGMLVPVIGIIQAGGQAMADRYSYLPQMGLCVMIAWGVKELVTKKAFLRPLAVLATGAVVLVLSICTVRQIEYWRTSESLWNHALAIMPDNALAHTSLGLALVTESRWDEAIEHFQKAIELRPDRHYAYNGLGFALMNKGRFDEAAGNFQKSIELKPDVPDTYYYLGTTLAQEGRAAEAIAQYRKAIALNPGYVKACFELAKSLAAQGQSAEASKYYEQVIQWQPGYVEAHNNLANQLAGQGRLADAVQQYQEAIRLKPDYVEARYNLATILATQSKFDEAAEQFRKVLELKPDLANAHGNLANVLVELGRLDEAVAQYQQTIALFPSNPQAHYKLGVALDKQKKSAAAIAEYQKALELDPGHVPAHLGLAWLLATCPDESLRDGNRALSLAQQAVQLSKEESTELYDTLAAAYAEAGQFPVAVDTARRALKLAVAAKDKPVVDAIIKRIELYEANTPYRENGGTNVSP